MNNHPDRFSDFYLHNNLGLDIKLIEFQYPLFKQYFTGSTCLELGPATGYMTRLLVHDFKTVHAVDGSQKLLDQIAPVVNLIKTCSLFEQYEPPQRFETIMMNHVLEHIEQPVELLKKIKNWLAPYGVLIVGVPNAKSFHRLAAVEMGLLDTEYQLNARDHELGHYRVYDFNLLEQAVKEAGFAVKKKNGTYLKFLSNAQMEKSMDDSMMLAYHKLGNQFIENCAEIILVLTH